MLLKRALKASVILVLSVAVIACNDNTPSNEGDFATVSISGRSVKIFVTGSQEFGGDGASLQGIVRNLNGHLAIATPEYVYIPVFRGAPDAVEKEFDTMKTINGWTIPGERERARFGGGEADDFAELNLPGGADKFWIVAPLTPEN